MGVHGLSSGLAKYAKRVSFLQGAAEPSQRIKAIIDGPSLAHHLHRAGKHNIVSGTVTSQYDYEELGTSAIEWLDRLVEFGFEIEGIFFDGALPAQKAGTRLSRMQSLLNRARNFKDQYDARVKTLAPGEAGLSASELHELGATSELVPTCPFLVSAVIEACLYSGYGEKTWLVNDEADGYCAGAALEAAVQAEIRARQAFVRKEPPSTMIFTSDSDLCIFKYRELNIKIAKLDEIKKITSLGVPRLSISELRPSDIQYNGSKPDLIAAAYVMERKNKTLPQALQHIEVNKQVTSQFADFSEAYDPLCYLPQLAIDKARRETHPMLARDARVSEAICQVEEQCAAAMANPTLEVHGEVDLYLPNLFEDYTRASAWKIGTHFREIAEWLLLESAVASSLLEYRRSGLKIVPREVQKVPFSEIEAWSLALHQQMNLVAYKASADLPTNAAWRMIVMGMALKGVIDLGMPRPSSAIVTEVLAGKALSSWECVQLSAHFQAMYYSFRMIQQVQQWKARCVGGRMLKGEVGEMVAGLPGIVAFFSSGRELSLETWFERVDQLVGMLSITHPPTMPVQEE